MRWRIFALAAVIVLLVDRLSKDWIVQHLELYESIPVLPPVLQITRTFNTGAAFGIGGEVGNVFLVLAVIISAVILYYVKTADAHARMEQFAYGMIFGGALGNVVDRVQQGQVVDFVHIVIPGVISNVSNFADHAIVIGVFVLLIDTLRRDFLAQKTVRDEKTPESSGEAEL